MSYNPPKVSSQYGAPMGRASYIDYIPTPKSCTLQKVNMTSDGAYDTGGAYWGQGAPLYHYSDGEGVCVYVRAWDRSGAFNIVSTQIEKELRKDATLVCLDYEVEAIFVTEQSLKRKP